MERKIIEVVNDEITTLEIRTMHPMEGTDMGIVILYIIPPKIHEQGRIIKL